MMWQDCAIHLQPWLTYFLNFITKQLVGLYFSHMFCGTIVRSWRLFFRQMWEREGDLAWGTIGTWSKRNVFMANNVCWAISEMAIKVLFWVLIFSSRWVSPIILHNVYNLLVDQSTFWCRFVVYKCLIGQTRFFFNCHECHFMSSSHSFERWGMQ